jgi:hypothetical protein
VVGDDLIGVTRHEHHLQIRHRPAQAFRQVLSREVGHDHVGQQDGDLVAVLPGDELGGDRIGRHEHLVAGRRQ